MTDVADPLEGLETLPKRRIRHLHIPSEECNLAGRPLKPAECHDQAQLSGHLHPIVKEGTRFREPATHRFQLGKKATHVASVQRVILVASKQRPDPVDGFAGRS
jgi:hypothetical protein